jgi:hypothetical protein
MIKPATMPFLAGVLPLLAVHAAYLLNLFSGAGLQTEHECMPYWDGCVSISRGVRSGPGLHLFRAIMLPTAVLLLISWALVREWLLRVAACDIGRARLISLTGMLGAVFLVFYVTWLGTEGDWYRWLRRYGVIFYFGGTALAQLLLAWVLWPNRRQLASGLIGGPVKVLMALVSLQWALGVFSAFKRLLFGDPAVIDRLENTLEWGIALPMSLGFIAIAWLFSRSGFRLNSNLDHH